jgi:hypothetical protein
MQKVIDKREIHTAADLLRYIEEVQALGYDLSTMYLHTSEADIGSVAFIEEKLSDGSLVWNLKLEAEPSREELPNCVWRGAATPFADNH